MENVIVHNFEMSFKSALVIFYFIGTLIREFIIMLSALISIFYLPIRYCSSEHWQKNIVRFSRENVRMHPAFKEFRSIVNS